MGFLGRDGHASTKLAAMVALALASGCAYPTRPCKCICACPAAQVVARVPAPVVQPSCKRQAALARELDIRRTFDEELTLQEARQIVEALANPEETAREGQALSEIAEFERQLSRWVEP